MIGVPGHEESCSGPARPGGDLVDQPGVAADLVQPDDGQRDEGGDDDEELQDLVVDRRREPAEGGVGEHDQRGRPTMRRPTAASRAAISTMQAEQRRG